MHFSQRAIRLGVVAAALIAIVAWVLGGKGAFPSGSAVTARSITQGGTTAYVVQESDCCWREIAARYGITASQLMALNDSDSPLLRVGQVVVVPAGGQVATEQAITPSATVPSSNTADTSPAESNAADTSPVDTSPVDTDPADTSPVDTSPDDTSPADTGPADSSPASSGTCIPAGTSSAPSKWDPEHRWRVAKPNRFQLHVFYEQAGPKGPVVSIGGSLSYGVAEVLTRDLVNAGYGPICVDARIGRQMAPVGGGQGGLNIAKRLKAVYPGQNVRWYAAFGNNDINSVSPATAVKRIQAILDVIGTTKHPVVWSNLVSCRTPEYKAKEAAFNAGLSTLNVVVHDWASIVRKQPKLLISDCLHVGFAGNKVRAASVMDVFAET